MAKGLDELIDRLVADIAYAGETAMEKRYLVVYKRTRKLTKHAQGLSVTSFIATVTSKLRGPQRRKGTTRAGKDGNEEAQTSDTAASQDSSIDEAAGLQLARKAWTWLAERPEILVGRDGSRKRMSLDDALALPESQPPVSGPTNGTDGARQGAASAGAASGATPQEYRTTEPAGPAPVTKQGTPGKRTKKAPADGAASVGAAEEDPTTRPRLYATERTIWNTVTGHDVDYKKIPPLEWKCLLGIASVRERGILQADLRALVNQDKRSVPKRTDFLAAKGYVVKRAILTRGNRTSILWLTEFAPVELHDGDDNKASRKTLPATDAASSFTFSKDLTSAGSSNTAVDFSPAFLTKDLAPVPWRSRWLGDSIEFASFGQTILAIVKAWGVIRVIDLKQKLGVQGLRWQMRTLSRICREFVACGVLRFVAAVRRDERRLFKDCMKFEREPTNSEWTMILASGRKRTPLTALLATQKKQRQQKEAGVQDQITTEDDLVDDDLDDDGDEGAAGLATAVTTVPSWIPELPLTNQVFEFVQKAGPNGTTAPAVTRTMLGPSFARYVFAMLTDLSRPRTQPVNLAHLQMTSEPTRVGRNSAYLFKAPASIGTGDSPFVANRYIDFSNVSAAQASTFFGFSTPAGYFAQQAQVHSLSESAYGAVLQHPAFVRRQRHWSPHGRGRGRPRREVQLPAEEVRERDDGAGDIRRDINEEAGNGGDQQNGEAVSASSFVHGEVEPSVTASEPPRRKRGRPPKARPDQPVPTPLLTNYGEDNDLVERSNIESDAGRAGGVHLSVHDSGCKDGVAVLPPVTRTDTTRSGGEKEGRTDREEGDNEDDREAAESRSGGNAPPAPRLHAVVSVYQGLPGRLTLDNETKAMRFVFDTGSETSRNPMAVPVGNIVNGPSIRDVPGGGGQAFVFEAREERAVRDGQHQQSSAATWPFVFVLTRDPPVNSVHAAKLLDALTTMLRYLHAPAGIGAPQQGQDKAQNGGHEEDGVPSSGVLTPSQPSGQRGPKKSRNPGPQGYVCEICGGCWKNLVGLRYHQRKSQTSCNSSYVPPPVPALNSRVLAKGKRNEMPLSSPSASSPPGLSQPLPDLSRRLFVTPTSDSRPRTRSSYNSLHSLRSMAPEATLSPSTAPAGNLLPQGHGAEETTGGGGLGANAHRQKTGEMEVANVTEEEEGIRTPPALRTILLSSTAASSISRPVSGDSPRGVSAPASTAVQPHAPALRTTGTPGFRMPAGTTNSLNSKGKATKFMVRSQRTIEIIKYLVDRYDGVFPSDRSLWYAVFGVYRRTFPGEEPPTFNVCKAAVKKLDTARELEEHTFGFRDVKGLFNYCRLVARPDTDVLQSEAAKDFKIRLQKNFPRPYVPPEYAPTDKDVAVLLLWDRDGAADDANKTRARAKRGRRSLAPEIEVLDAPFYGKPSYQRQTMRAGGGGPFLIDYGQSDGSEDGEGNDEQRQRSATSRHNPLAGRNGGGEDGNSAKRRKVTRFADYIAGNDEDEALDDEEDGEEEDDSDVSDGYFDNEDNIDPALRTRRTPRNPGLNSLPATFFPPGSQPQGSKTGLAQKRPAFSPGDQPAGENYLPMFVFVQPGNGKNDKDDNSGYYDNSINDNNVHSCTTATHTEVVGWLQPKQHEFVAKHVVLQDSGSAPGVWPRLSQTFFQQEAPACFTMDGVMPSRKALLRENLPRSVDDCVDMLRANQKLPSADDTPAGRFFFDVDCCRFWELSQKGTQILCYNASVAPQYVFFNLMFPGTHYTAERDKEAKAEVEGPQTEVLQTPALWDTGNQFTVESLPYRMLEDTEDLASAPTQSRPSQRGLGSRGRGRGGHRGSSRTGLQRPAKYVLRSRREMTAYPQKPEDYIRKEAARGVVGANVVNISNHGGDEVDWKAEDTRIAAFVAVKTLVGGLSQAMDWGLLMRLFPDWKLSALRLFWTSIRKQRPAYIDQLTQQFQQSFLEAYTNKELPAFDFDHVAAYDWPRLVSWTVRLMRRDAVHAVLPATRRDLAQAYDCVEQTPRMVGWREEYFHSARSMWNRLQDSASEAAALSIDPGPPVTPAEALAASSLVGGKSLEVVRHMVARSWIRALCAMPHDRYPPSRIKQKLLTLGAGLGGESGNGDEAAVNRLLQTVIAELQNERVLRRSKSVVSLGGRMYVLAEAYGNTLEKVAQQDKFRQAWAFKAELDACFRASPRPAYEIPLTMNDDGMVMALINLQAHGRVAVQAIDAPHVPFGFEPGNYETRKFPKHYQRFRQRIVPTARYVYNDEAELQTLVQRAREAAEAEMRTDTEAEGAADAPSSSSPMSSKLPREMPVWRDFFGVLDRPRFAKLASAVVFSQATRGATPLKQTAAHLRPVLEPFEVQLLMDWATTAGIFAESELPGGGGGPASPAEDPVGRTVSEWWWLLTGQVYVEMWAEEEKEKERAKEREKWQTIVISDDKTKDGGGDATAAALDSDEDADEGADDGADEEMFEVVDEDGEDDGDYTMSGALP